ncbi:hypothetical protein FSARC_3977 [Fusarium sarcochroum]|uniref:Zn(2)-C6 fungal-type domain-containing protein n=1 Tax=Fusarium sarcochroum TaxID=1208366 RepID=A0A8H4U2N9_9HYPO|nr:hypothetical protein FSARC_3977 [Fusarium sarcochroum]
MEREHRVRKRAQKACAKCREDKVKCTGSFPCQRCVKRKLTCDLNNGPGKNGIPKGYLHKLKSRTAATIEQTKLPEGRTDAGQCNRLGTPSRPIESDEGVGSLHAHERGSEPVQESEQSIPIPASTPRHLASLRHSPEAPITNPLAVDCSNYFCDASGRPIHLGTSSNWSFGRRVLLMSYEKVKHTSLSPDHLHFDAFGKAFVVQASKGRKPAGAEFFTLAMKLLPNFYFIVGDYMQLVQIMCCAALYLHCTDFRGAAYRMIGQALRIALEDGMHTEMHSQDVNNAYAQRCRRVWWTVYILDRQMSSLMGVPMAMSDDSIHAALPTFPGDAQKSEAMDIQIKLSQVLGHILNSVYGAEGRLDKQFLRTTKDALKRIASVTDQLNTSFTIPQNGSTQGISRISASLHLLHHQCIILTTRPLLYSLLQARINQSDMNLVHALRSGSVRTLLLMCIDSAQQIMDILVTLQEQTLLESFLRSDLDAAFTSTITLSMAPVIDPSLMKTPSPWVQCGYIVLDDMISCGNMVAVQVKSELQQLEGVFNCLPVEAVGASGSDQRPTLRDQLSEQDQYFQASTAASSPLMTHMAVSPTLENDLLLDEAFWQHGLTTEQLINFANSIDMSSLDFL